LLEIPAHIGQEAALDKDLESIADAEDESARLQMRSDFVQEGPAAGQAAETHFVRQRLARTEIVTKEKPPGKFTTS